MNKPLRNLYLLSAVFVSIGLTNCSDAGSSAPTPGEWRGDQAAFHLENDLLTGWWLQGMYCEADAGAPTCLATPIGVPTASAELDNNGFVLSLGDLTLQGTFVTQERVEGVWLMDAPGCCTASGDWSAVLIEALPEPVVVPGDAPTDPTQTITDPGQPKGDVCELWAQDRIDLAEPAWLGGTSECDAGDIDDDGRARALD